MNVRRSTALFGLLAVLALGGCDKKQDTPPITSGAPTGQRGTQPTVAGSEQSARNSASGAATRPDH